MLMNSNPNLVDGDEDIIDVNQYVVDVNNGSLRQKYGIKISKFRLTNGSLR